MKRAVLAVILAVGGFILTQPAHAVVCAAGVYRAGCIGPRGAVAVRRPYYGGYYRGGAVVRSYRGGAVAVRGPHGAAIRGPRGGAAVVRR